MRSAPRSSPTNWERSSDHGWIFLITAVGSLLSQARKGDISCSVDRGASTRQLASGPRKHHDAVVIGQSTSRAGLHHVIDYTRRIGLDWPDVDPVQPSPATEIELSTLTEVLLGGRPKP